MNTLRTIHRHTAAAVGICTVTIVSARPASAQEIRPLSRGWYRLPYDVNWQGPGGEAFAGHEEGDFNLFINNHNGYDLIAMPRQAWDSAAPHKIVAMADGVVCQAEDCWNGCYDSGCGLDTSGMCPCDNFVWIEHPNGEFSAYLHIAQGSLRVQPGDCVVAGQYIADEGDVGSTASGTDDDGLQRDKRGCDGTQDPSAFAFPFCAVHLHFGVYSTLDVATNPDAKQVIPRICGIPDHVIQGNGRIVNATGLGNCDALACGDENVDVSDSFTNEQKVIVANSTVTTSGAPVIQNSVIGFEAGQKVTLGPGFRVAAGSYFRASIGSCYPADSGCPTPGPAGCPDPNPFPVLPPCPSP